MNGLPTWSQFSGYGADVMKSAPARQALKQNFGSPGRISTPPPERPPPVRQHCPLLRRNRRVEDRRSARGCPLWWQRQDAPRRRPERLKGLTLSGFKGMKGAFSPLRAITRNDEMNRPMPRKGYRMFPVLAARPQSAQVVVPRFRGGSASAPARAAGTAALPETD